jgi:cytoskeletal protein CcmA (bactofilin family)
MALFSKNKVAIDLQTISTLISEGSILDGNLKAPAVARIDGQLNGDVIVEEGLILGEKGSIKGNILTKELVIYGVVNGNIQSNSLEIKSTGRVNGEIRTQTLIVENGAIYNGSLSMANNNKIDAKISTNQKVIQG